MKILMISEDFPHPNLGGLGRHAVTLSNALVKAGHTVSFLGNDLHPLVLQEGENNVRVPFVAGLPLRHRGWKEKQLGFFNYAKRWYTARSYARAILAHASEFDVVHYHGHAPNLANFIPDEVNFVQSRHDQGADCLTHIRFRQHDICRETDARACAGCVTPNPNGLQIALSADAVQRYRGAVGRALGRHKTIYVSRMLLDNLRRTLPPQPGERTYVIHNFVDKSVLQKGLSGAPGAVDEAGFLTVGRVDAAKGIVAFANAWRTHASPDLPFTIIGDGPDRPALEAIVSGPGYRYLGLQPYRDVVAAILGQRFVVVPSVWEEPCATTILEAMALGKTVLALERGGTPELRRYQAYEGQLRLFSGLEELAAAAAELRSHRSPLSAVEALGAFPWGVDDALPHILKVYQA